MEALPLGLIGLHNRIARGLKDEGKHAGTCIGIIGDKPFEFFDIEEPATYHRELTNKLVDAFYKAGSNPFYQNLDTSPET